MKINFETEHSYIDPTVNRTSYSGRCTTDSSIDMSAASSFLVSFGDNSNGMNVYADKDDASKLQSKLAMTDVSTKRNYMAVMSLSMSNEDYAKMVKTGEVPEDMDVTDSVTIIDEIKAALIKGGTSVNGYTDDIDKAKLVEITGSEAAANDLISSMHVQDVPVNEESIGLAYEAVEMAKASLPLTDSATKYLIENEKAPTIKNIYQASHSGNSSERANAYYSQDGYLSKAAGVEDIDALKPQIEEIVRKSGIEDTIRATKEAEFMLSKGMPLTVQNLLRLDELASLREGLAENQIVSFVAIAMSAGTNPREANLTYTDSLYVQAEQLMKKVSSISDETIKTAVDNNISLNIRNLSRIEESKEAANTNSDEVNLIDYTNQSTEELHARRVLEEVRLSMTVSANRLLLRSNFQIDIAPMEELIDALKSAEKVLNSTLFATDDMDVASKRASIYEQAKSELETIPSLPASILGQLDEAGDLEFTKFKPFTLHDVYESGVSRQSLYMRAGETYEALMTAPKSDMGDSIKKAFRNVDDILRERNIEINDANRRAVRILGYNSMEITPENIEQVREADTNLQRVISGLTPGRVLKMIREDVNPMNMTVSKLGEYLDAQDEDPEKKAQDYARFLMQLEKHDEITELERESYIGIYRMLNSLDKTDDAAVGSILKMGSQMSFSNLLSAMRTAAKSYFDVTVDDTFGGMDSSYKTKAIDDQINASFKNNMMDSISQYEESSVENLIGMGSDVSPMNLEALELLRHKRGNWFKIVKESVLDQSKDSMLFEEAIEKMTDVSSAQSAYTTLMNGLLNRVSEAILQKDSYIDVKAMQMSMRQISLLTKRAEEEEYDFPAVIDGEATAIRLKIRHENGAGLLSIAFETEGLGRVAAQFDLSGEKSGFVAYNRASSKSAVDDAIVEISEGLSFVPEAIYAEDLDLARFTDKITAKENDIKKPNDVENKADINNTELYRIARKFIGAVNHI